MNQNQEPTRKALRGVEVDEWLNHCAPEGAFLQQAPRPGRTCAELGVCQNRKEPCTGCKPAEPVATARPVKPRTAWMFEIVFSKLDLMLLALVVSLAYAVARS